MEFNNNYDYSEFYKLAVTLIVRGYTVEVTNIWDGKQLSVYKQSKLDDREKEFSWDVVIHKYSYGHEDGLLEAYGTIVEKFNDYDTVQGYLTADEILKHCPKLPEALF